MVFSLSPRHGTPPACIVQLLCACILIGSRNSTNKTTELNCFFQNLIIDRKIDFRQLYANSQVAVTGLEVTGPGRSELLKRQSLPSLPSLYQLYNAFGIRFGLKFLSQNI